MTTVQASGTAIGISEGGAIEVSPSELRGWLDRSQAVLVDVREADEHLRESIAGSISVPLSRFDAGLVPGAERVVFHCYSGARARQAAGRAMAAGRGSVYSLKGGIKRWKAAGLPVERRPGVPISIMRQVQIAAGTLVLACSVL